MTHMAGFPPEADDESREKTRVLRDVARALGLDAVTLAPVLGTSAYDAATYLQGADVPVATAAFRNVLRLVRLVAALNVTQPDDASRRAWLLSHDDELGGVPWTVASSSEQAFEEVVDRATAEAASTWSRGPR